MGNNSHRKNTPFCDFVKINLRYVSFYEQILHYIHYIYLIVDHACLIKLIGFKAGNPKTAFSKIERVWFSKG